MIYADGFWWPKGTEDYRHRYLQHRYDGQAVLDKIKQYRTCIQAGGHVGTWPTWLAQHFKKVHTFEADPDNLECLKLNVQDYSNIIVHNAALSKHSGRVGWSHSPKNSGGHYVVPTGDDVECATIDSLNLTDCDALFLDIEGSELNALKGAVETLDRCNPALMLEFNTKGEKVGLSTREGLRAWLEKRGYREVAKVAKDRVFVR